MIRRFIVKADGEVVGHAETERKAWQIGRKYADHCYNQDVPCYPEIKVEKEEIQ